MSCNILIYFVAFLYTYPFLVVSYSNSDMQKMSQPNIIAGSVGFRLQMYS